MTKGTRRTSRRSKTRNKTELSKGDANIEQTSGSGCFQIKELAIPLKTANDQIKTRETTKKDEMSLKYRKEREMPKKRSIPMAHKLQTDALPRATNTELQMLQAVSPRGQ